MKNQTQRQRVRICKLCAKTYILNPKYSNKQIENSKFCSRECQYLGKDKPKKGEDTRVDMVCCVCLKSFKQNTYYRRYKTIHCSQKCAGVTNGIRQKGKIITKEQIEKTREVRLKNGSYNFSEEWKRKIREYQSKRDRSREKNPNWKGGYDIKNALRKTKAYKEWRTAVFERDSYACVECGTRFIKGITGRVYLEADHIKPFASYPELRLEINNGRTLCKPCHMKTETWGGRSIKKV